MVSRKKALCTTSTLDSRSKSLKDESGEPSSVRIPQIVRKGNKMILISDKVQQETVGISTTSYERSCAPRAAASSSLFEDQGNGQTNYSVVDPTGTLKRTGMVKTASERLEANLPLTVEQAAEITTLHPNTIRRSIKAGKIKALHMSDRRIVITAGEVHRLITSGIAS